MSRTSQSCSMDSCAVLSNISLQPVLRWPAPMQPMPTLPFAALFSGSCTPSPDAPCVHSLAVKPTNRGPSGLPIARTQLPHAPPVRSITSPPPTAGGSSPPPPSSFTPPSLRGELPTSGGARCQDTGPAPPATNPLPLGGALPPGGPATGVLPGVPPAAAAHGTGCCSRGRKRGSPRPAAAAAGVTLAGGWLPPARAVRRCAAPGSAAGLTPGKPGWPPGAAAWKARRFCCCPPRPPLPAMNGPPPLRCPAAPPPAGPAGRAGRSRGPTNRGRGLLDAKAGGDGWLQPAGCVPGCAAGVPPRPARSHASSSQCRGGGLPAGCTACCTAVPRWWAPWSAGARPPWLDPAGGEDPGRGGVRRWGVALPFFPASPPSRAGAKGDGGAPHCLRRRPLTWPWLAAGGCWERGLQGGVGGEGEGGEGPC